MWIGRFQSKFKFTSCGTGYQISKTWFYRRRRAYSSNAGQSCFSPITKHRQWKLYYFKWKNLRGRVVAVWQRKFVHRRKTRVSDPIEFTRIVASSTFINRLKVRPYADISQTEQDNIATATSWRKQEEGLSVHNLQELLDPNARWVTAGAQA
jgi:hypothetical protein